MTESNSSDETFEDLQAFLSGGFTDVTVQNNENRGKLDKANGNASLTDLIEMISKLVSKSPKMKQYNTKFEPDEGMRIAVDPTEKLEEPHIQYIVVSRRPILEKKPRIREQFSRTDKNGNKVQGAIYGQKMECIIQFNIIACDYVMANAVMNSFEDLMFESTSYFKEKGISEIIFRQQFTDDDLDVYRDRISIRTLQYLVLTEKLYTVIDTNVANISDAQSIG